MTQAMLVDVILGASSAFMVDAEGPDEWHYRGNAKWCMHATVSSEFRPNRG